ncbi:MAG: sulfatase [Opitutaceae bacterium]|jgi:iduronate 2-sulfatase|nr:sulfatase [Opitutaceae bacterium]
MSRFRSTFALLGTLFITCLASEAEQRPNVLFIAVDDLRPEFAAYGADHISSPHLDKFAGESVRFDRAYCMVPTCGASRASMLTGVRPTATRFVSFTARADEEAPWAKTLNTHFQDNGYRTGSLGKVFHAAADNAAGWTDKPWRPQRGHYQLPANVARTDQKLRGPPTESAPVPDDAYGDGVVVNQAVERLQDLAANDDQPFFLAVGFYKPHLPFVAPQKYWDLYPPESIKLPDNYQVPENAPAESHHTWGELRAYQGIPKKGPITDATALNLIRGYYACVSYTDAQVGKVLNELKRLGLADNTIVVLWGDHGWNLGDHTYWNKHSTFESSMRIPLMVRAPGIKGGTHTAGLTESIDIYPSLCELTGLPIPETVEGKSFVPLLRFPERPWAEAAVGRFVRGDTIRTADYRYTEYRDDRGAGPRKSDMLYDHRTDPLENINISQEPAHAEIAAALNQALQAAKRSTVSGKNSSP